jgi:hypothetical protein
VLPRVHAELTLGLGIGIGYNQVELLMVRAGIRALPGSNGPGHGIRPRPPVTWSTGLSHGHSLGQNANRAAEPATLQTRIELGTRSSSTSRSSTTGAATTQLPVCGPRSSTR